jgi:hypothetical protein
MRTWRLQQLLLPSFANEAFTPTWDDEQKQHHLRQVCKWHQGQRLESIFAPSRRGGALFCVLWAFEASWVKPLTSGFWDTRPWAPAWA